jgi:hypothetical protein
MEVIDMNKNKRVYITAVAVLTSTLLTISSAFAVDYYPEGPQLNVAVDTVTSGGWELCFSDEFDDIGTPVQNMLDQCTGEYIMLAGKYNNQADIAVLAAGASTAVFQVQTEFNQKTLNNGTYFYFFPNETVGEDRSQSIGFSLSEVTDIYTCDVESDQSDYRLCRHIDGADGQGYFDDGYRIGGNRSNGGLQATFLVYQYTGNVSSTSPNTALLAQAERQKQDTFILAAATLAIASVSNSLSQLTASLLPKTVCVKKGKKSKSVSVLQACPKGYTAKKR